VCVKPKLLSVPDVLQQPTFVLGKSVKPEKVTLNYLPLKDSESERIRVKTGTNEI
jgi:hypothetical protein